MVTPRVARWRTACYNGATKRIFLEADGDGGRPMKVMNRLALLPMVALILAACQAGASPTSTAMTSEAASASPSAAPDYLARIETAGVIRVSTDPNYAPQSFLNPDTEEFEGFDIDVAKEIAKRLGVDIEFETPDWEAIIAGNWSERWDMSVGSMTITEDRKQVIDFTQPYYYTPAQMATFPNSGIDSLDDLAGKTVCVGSGTTYLDWLEGHLRLPPEAGDVTLPPDGVQATTLKTDVNCAEAWRSGRFEFEGWLSSITTVEGTIVKDFPVVKVGDPVFYEPLAVAFDNKIEDNNSLVAEVDRIIGEMHDDGTLTELSKKWFCTLPNEYPCENPEEDGIDLTTRQ
jgi:polar amino acid transport system substrate-binding protein